MSPNIFSVVIVLLILLCGVLGSKRGILKELVVIVGTIVVFAIAFFLKDPIASFFCTYLPFFNFKIPIGNLVSLNVIFYQLIAFLLIVIVLRLVLQILIDVTGIFSKIINATIILALPNKLLGFVVGILEGYILMFIILNVIAIPMSGSELFMSSGVRRFIVNDTPVLKDCLGGLNYAIDDVLSLSSNDDRNTNDLKVIDIMLKYNVVSTEFMDNVKETGKLDSISGLDNVIDQYREG